MKFRLHLPRILFTTLATIGISTLLATTSFAAPDVDLSKLPENAITAYTMGSQQDVLADISPILSNSSGYSEKWEFFLYGDVYTLRLKFEISNFAFSKNEGKVKGFLKKTVNGEPTEFPISKTYKNGEWTSKTDALDLVFGDYKLSYDGENFHLSGVYEKGTFSYVIPANLWKPGTGNVYFGNSENNVFKYNILTYHKEAQATITDDGNRIDIKAQTYGNHYATTLAVYDMFDEFGDFRKREEDIHVEFRYYIPSAKYEAKPFGFMFAAYHGTPVFWSTDIETIPLETWLDDEHYGYEINARQRITAKDNDGNTATLEMLTANPTPSDPYADLPAFQRNIASRFAKPIEYNIKFNWELWLNVDGFKAKIPQSGAYSLTRMR